MAKCKYPNEVCANMTILNGIPYCDSTPCSLKNKLPKQTNADRIRKMSDEELAEFLYGVDHFVDDGQCIVCFEEIRLNDDKADILDWLQSEVKGSDV